MFSEVETIDFFLYVSQKVMGVDVSVNFYMETIIFLLDARYFYNFDAMKAVDDLKISFTR